jgi:4-nitrophenyl phosphatase
MMEMKRYRAILFDGDGVLWKLNQTLPGFDPIFDLIQEQELNWALLTNNSTLTIDKYIRKLGKFGITASHQNVFSSSTAAREYLLERFGKGVRLHVIGMDGLAETLLEAGFIVTQGEEQPEEAVAAVVAGLDPFINYKKLTVAVRLILGGAAFIATNSDGTFPAPDGIYPGAGMVVGALQFSSGVQPYTAGKPHPAIFRSALKSLGVEPGDTLMVGDRLETDIEGAAALGIHTAAVLTGITSREEIAQSKIKPDFIFEDLSHLHTALDIIYNINQ